MRWKGYQIRRQISVCGISTLQQCCAKRPYCGLVGGCCGAGGVWPGAGVVVVGVAGFTTGFFFFTAGFLAGSVSSNTIFLGGAAGIAAWAAFRSVRNRTISASLADDRVSIRCANCFRVPSKLLRSLESD